MAPSSRPWWRGGVLYQIYPFLYYGDELGMRQVEVPPERVLDVYGRDGARTPMPWGDAEWHQPWLPLGDSTRAVDDQRSDPSSVLSFCRNLLQLRRARGDLAHGTHERIDTDQRVWAWRRGEDTKVAVNLSGDDVGLELEGELLLSTTDSEDRTTLGPWEGVILET